MVTYMNNYYRKKLIHTVLYFAKNINRPNTTVMCKLLNSFDFDHFCETGYPALGLQYYTFPRGPVPKDFWLEIKGGNVPEDFKKYIGIHIEEHTSLMEDFKEYIFKPKPKAKLNMSLFSKREKEILERLVLKFKYVDGKTMKKITHAKGEPWDTTKNKYGLGAIIEYNLALKKDSCISSTKAAESLKEYFEMADNFDLSPI